MEHEDNNYFGTVNKGLLKGMEDLEVGGRVGTIQTTALLRKARILRRVMEKLQYGRQRCVFLVLLMLNRRPSGPALCWMMAFFTASYQHLLWTPNSIGAPEGPLGRMWLFLPHHIYNSVRSLTV